MIVYDNLISGSILNEARLDAELIERNLSPGGSADLLAMAFFLEKALPLLGQEEA